MRWARRAPGIVAGERRPPGGVENSGYGHGILLPTKKAADTHCNATSPNSQTRGLSAKDLALVTPERYSEVTVKHSVLSTIPTPEKPALSDEQRTARLRLLAERLRRPDGLDRDTLKHVEQLTDAEQ